MFINNLKQVQFDGFLIPFHHGLKRVRYVGRANGVMAAARLYRIGANNLCTIRMAAIVPNIGSNWMVLRNGMYLAARSIKALKSTPMAAAADKDDKLTALTAVLHRKVVAAISTLEFPLAAAGVFSDELGWDGGKADENLMKEGRC